MLIHSIAEHSKPIFVVGMNASGTTLLADCLGRHSEIYSFVHETRVLPHIIENVGSFGDLRRDDSYAALWRELVNIPTIAIQLDGDSEFPEGWNNWPRNLAGILDGLFRHLASRADVLKPRWCEKTPMHALHMLELAGVFPQAKFIHVIRDGRDCAASFHRRWRRTPELTIFRWRETIKAARSQAEHLGGNYIEVKFDELTASPEQVFSSLCSWLGIGYEPSLLEVRKRKQTNPGRDKIEKNSGAWRSYFADSMGSKLEHISGGSLVSNGFETTYCCVDHDPSKWQKRGWLISDYARQLASETRQQIAGHPYRTWPMFFRYLHDAYRQLITNKAGK